MDLSDLRKMSLEFEICFCLPLHLRILTFGMHESTREQLHKAFLFYQRYPDSIIKEEDDRRPNYSWTTDHNIGLLPKLRHKHWRLPLPFLIILSVPILLIILVLAQRHTTDL
jgi:hypothetical protein